MSFEEALYALLTSPSPTSVGDRVYPIVAPEDAELPFIVYDRVDTEALWVLSGQSNLDAVYVDILVHARTASEARSVAEEVRAILASDVTLKCKLENDETDFDFERKLYLVNQTWRGWDKRSS